MTTRCPSTRAGLLLAAACALLSGAGCRPTPAPETWMDEVIPASLRGEDEVGEAPPGYVPRARGDLAPLGRAALQDLAKRSESVGSPNQGRLLDGFAFPEAGPGWLQRGSRPYGTDELVTILAWALREIHGRFPGSAPLFVADLSPQGGGPAPPHISHQSGRDVDTGYYLKHNVVAYRFVPVDRTNLDARKTWLFIEALLSTGMVQYLFIDHAVQALLYDAALERGFDPEELVPIFQFPRPRTAPQGIIRHAKGHDDHLHLRIHCPPADGRCEN